APPPTAPWRLFGPGLSPLYAAASAPLLDQVGRTAVPVVAVHGDCDLVVPLAAARDTARRTGGGAGGGPGGAPPRGPRGATPPAGRAAGWSWSTGGPPPGSSRTPRPCPRSCASCWVGSWARPAPGRCSRPGSSQGPPRGRAATPWPPA